MIIDVIVAYTVDKGLSLQPATRDAQLLKLKAEKVI